MLRISIGRALEELRVSMFSKLRLFGGAKRQPQSLLGPTIALTFNFLVSVSIILMNKLLVDNGIFKSLVNYLSIISPEINEIFFVVVSGIVMSLSTGLANVSLKYNSVGFYQMAKIAVTPAIVFSEFILFRKKISVQKVLALAVVSFGVAVATVTDLQFHFFGACVALAWIVPSAVNKILWSNLQQQDNWTALALMWKTTPITLFFLVMLMPYLDPPGVLSFDWSLYNASTIGVSAVLGFLLQWSGALALGATSATTHVVLGQFKTCVILLGGFLLFGSNPGQTSILGAATALIGMSFYMYLNLHSRQQSGGKISSRQSTLPLSKLKLSQENGGADDGGGEEHV
ncbi:hypothetical protein DH2020_014071 [Rehmannia glutinosa]|uniref:Sugar phosphate transporter domain-containing protein n=1 Tax=Rehmannia glutinosa TaxID=99300 RepID=A0ABR0WWT2_REHGL